MPMRRTMRLIGFTCARGWQLGNEGGRWVSAEVSKCPGADEGAKSRLISARVALPLPMRFEK